MRSKLNPSTAKAIIQARMARLTIPECARAGGVSEQTVKLWLGAHPKKSEMEKAFRDAWFACSRAAEVAAVEELAAELRSVYSDGHGIESDKVEVTV